MGVELFYMRITKCDLCKKKIVGDTIEASFGYSSRAELCNKCGAPVLSFLKKHGIVSNSDTKSKNRKSRLI